MAFTVYVNSDEQISLSEYIEFLELTVDFRDPASILESAPKLRALVNDRDLVARQLHEQIKQYSTSVLLPSSHVIFLGIGTKFYVRANIWPTMNDMAKGQAYQDQVGYHCAHDHNYNFMTVNYLGKGYRTDIYEYDYNRLKGYVGERAELSYLETVDFTSDMVMLYRASVDMHIQHPPEDLSISLNLMVSHPEFRTRNQYFFDMHDHTVMQFPPHSENSLRASLIQIAGHTGNEETYELLEYVARKHQCWRTRLTALESMIRLSPANAVPIWESACKDGESLIVNAASRNLAAIQSTV